MQTVIQVPLVSMLVFLLLLIAGGIALQLYVRGLGDKIRGLQIQVNAMERGASVEVRLRRDLEGNGMKLHVRLSRIEHDLKRLRAGLTTALN